MLTAFSSLGPSTLPFREEVQLLRAVPPCGCEIPHFAGICGRPDDLLVGSYLEQPTLFRNHNQRIAVGKTLALALFACIKSFLFFSIRPWKALRLGIILQDPRAIGQATVVKEKDTTIVEKMRIVLGFPGALRRPDHDARVRLL